MGAVRHTARFLASYPQSVDAYAETRLGNPAKPIAAPRTASVLCLSPGKARILSVACTGTAGNTARLRHALAAALSTGHPQAPAQRPGGTLRGTAG